MNGDINKEARTWGMWCHLSSIVVWIPVILLRLLGIPVPIPCLNILAPFIIWQTKKNTDAFIDVQGKESLNFQISMLVYSVIGVIIFIFLAFVTCGILSSNSNVLNSMMGTLAIGIVSIGLLSLIFQLFVVIFAAIKAYRGEIYRYPFTIRFLK
ncbi:DUF4870 domain-containing protein [Argonema antarcticum]|uniref:DUF4870 domain-containing protein n=1 Tax=Argonema antarcticum TaxID=2942763 RepID=UPI002013B237|nr:DUF4870 domain-containing protein [Argonema antarcticum]MCL1475395.1 DUF4870 domain-containing protein [Argonema antarcticum A004/B2]